MKQPVRPFIPILFLFLILSGIVWLSAGYLRSKNLDPYVISIGNLVLYFATYISFTMAMRSLQSPNPHAFVRAVYASMMTKMGVCIVALVIYLISTHSLNKYSLFVCMGLYLVYSAIEVYILNRQIRHRKNA